MFNEKQLKHRLGELNRKKLKTNVEIDEINHIQDCLEIFDAKMQELQSCYDQEAQGKIGDKKAVKDNMNFFYMTNNTLNSLVISNEKKQKSLNYLQQELKLAKKTNSQKIQNNELIKRLPKKRQAKQSQLAQWSNQALDINIQYQSPDAYKSKEKLTQRLESITLKILESERLTELQENDHNVRHLCAKNLVTDINIRKRQIRELDQLIKIVKLDFAFEEGMNKGANFEQLLYKSKIEVEKGAFDNQKNKIENHVDDLQNIKEQFTHKRIEKQREISEIQLNIQFKKNELFRLKEIIGELHKTKEKEEEIKVRFDSIADDIFRLETINFYLMNMQQSTKSGIMLDVSSQEQLKIKSVGIEKALTGWFDNYTEKSKKAMLSYEPEEVKMYILTVYNEWTSQRQSLIENYKSLQTQKFKVEKKLKSELEILETLKENLVLEEDESDSSFKGSQIDYLGRQEKLLGTKLSQMDASPRNIKTNQSMRQFLPVEIDNKKLTKADSYMHININKNFVGSNSFKKQSTVNFKNQHTPNRFSKGSGGFTTTLKASKGAYQQGTNQPTQNGHMSSFSKQITYHKLNIDEQNSVGQGSNNMLDLTNRHDRQRLTKSQRYQINKMKNLQKNLEEGNEVFRMNQEQNPASLYKKNNINDSQLAQTIINFGIFQIKISKYIKTVEEVTGSGNYYMSEEISKEAQKLMTSGTNLLLDLDQNNVSKEIKEKIYQQIYHTKSDQNSMESVNTLHANTPFLEKTLSKYPFSFDNYPDLTLESLQEILCNSALIKAFFNPGELFAFLKSIYEDDDRPRLYSQLDQIYEVAVNNILFQIDLIGENFKDQTHFYLYKVTQNVEKQVKIYGKSLAEKQKDKPPNLGFADLLKRSKHKKLISFSPSSLINLMNSSSRPGKSSKPLKNILDPRQQHLQSLAELVKEPQDSQRSPNAYQKKGKQHRTLQDILNQRQEDKLKATSAVQSALVNLFEKIGHNEDQREKDAQDDSFTSRKSQESKGASKDKEKQLFALQKPQMIEEKLVQVINGQTVFYDKYQENKFKNFMEKAQLVKTLYSKKICGSQRLGNNPILDLNDMRSNIQKMYPVNNKIRDDFKVRVTTKSDAPLPSSHLKHSSMTNNMLAVQIPQPVKRRRSMNYQFKNSYLQSQEPASQNQQNQQTQQPKNSGYLINRQRNGTAVSNGSYNSHRVLKQSIQIPNNSTIKINMVQSQSNGFSTARKESAVTYRSGYMFQKKQSGGGLEQSLTKRSQSKRLGGLSRRTASMSTRYPHSIFNDSNKDFFRIEQPDFSLKKMPMLSKL